MTYLQASDILTRHQVYGHGADCPCPIKSEKDLLITSKILITMENKNKLRKIGAAWNCTSKSSGRKYINLRFDEGAYENLGNLDFVRNICLYPNDKRTSEKSPDFSVVAPMPDDYQPKFIKSDKKI